MTESEKPKKAEEMSKPELRAYIESLDAGQEFRISQGVYVYRQADLTLTYFVRIYYGKKHEYWDHESQLEAEAFYSKCLREIEQSRNQGVAWDPEKYKKRSRLAQEQTHGMTIAEFGQWWLTTVVLERNPHTTHRKYREYLTNHVYPFFDNGACPMRSITELSLEQFSWHFKKKVSARTGKKLKVSTLHTILRMLYGFFCVAKVKGVIAENPFINKTMTEIAGEKDEVELAAFTPEQEATFLRGVRRYEPEWCPLFLTLQRTAARTGEVLALKEEDLDFKARKIKIVRHFAEGLILDKTKTKKARTIDMTEQLAHELQRYLDRRHEEERIRGIRFEFLFGWEPHQPIAMRTLQEVYNALRDFLKLPPIKLYGTRHTALARLCRTTKDLPYTKKQAGHASIKSTLIYEDTMPREEILVDCLDTPMDENETVAEASAPELTVIESAPLLATPPAVILPESGIDLSATLKRYEQDLLRHALERTKGNRQAAAALLGISYDTLLARLRAARRWEAKNADGSAPQGVGASPAA
ncbi:MAG: tyrosine-type recombinase/integrase [Nitrospira sp.]|nr:tyrosine-type recombinase/integrase [Nitrospira sp.]